MSGKIDYHKIIHLGRKCLVCNADAWLLLPIPVAGRSMLSDGSVVSEPLKKCTCSTCGLVQHVDAQDDENIRNYFGSSYSLGDHEPNIGFEGERQRQYAEWIVGSLRQLRPESILELGCGNGSLLKELMTKFGSAKAVGLEPSERGVKRAQECGLPVHRAYIAGENSVRGFSGDLVVSINVIEHTLCPISFLKAAKAAVNDGGLVLLICPDGSAVGSELLFFDHWHSFCPSNIASLVRSSGLMPIASQCSPAGLSGFQMVIAATYIPEKYKFQQESAPPGVDVQKLHTSRISYLARWRHLDSKLCSAMDGFRTTTVFGVGEMAQLIRAYSPSTWERINNFVVDDPIEDEFFGRPVIPYTELKVAPNRLVLLAVSQLAAAKLSARLRAAGHSVLAIDSLDSTCEDS
jgi:SAM-dependent methyltransferase